MAACTMYSTNVAAFFLSSRLLIKVVFNGVCVKRLTVVMVLVTSLALV